MNELVESCKGDRPLRRATQFISNLGFTIFVYNSIHSYVHLLPSVYLTTLISVFQSTTSALFADFITYNTTHILLSAIQLNDVYLESEYPSVPFQESDYGPLLKIVGSII